MKKIMLAASLLCAMVGMTGCTNDDLVKTEMVSPETVDGLLLQVDIKAAQENQAARNTVDKLGKCAWEDGDVLRVAAIKKVDLDDQNDRSERGAFKARMYSFVYNAQLKGFVQRAEDEKLVLEDGVAYYLAVAKSDLGDSFEYGRDPYDGSLFSISSPLFSVGVAKQQLGNATAHLSEMDHLLGMTEVTGGEKQISLSVGHQTTMMKFTVKNATGEPFNLRGLKLKLVNKQSSGQDGLQPTDVLSGTLKYNLLIPAMEEYDGYSGIQEVQLEKECVLENNQTMELFTMVHSFAIEQDEQFEMRLETDKGSYTKVYTRQDATAKTFLPGQLNNAILEVKALSAVNEADIYIPDAHLKETLLTKLGRNVPQDLYGPEAAVTKAELESLTELYVNDGMITSLEGIQYMTALTLLKLECRISLQTLDLSKNTELIELSMYDSAIGKVDLSNNKKLQTVFLDNMNLTQVVLPKTDVLKNVSFMKNPLTSLDLNNLPALDQLYLNDCTQLKDVKLEQSTNLTYLSLSNTAVNITAEQIKKMTKMQTLVLGNLNYTSLDLTGMNNLEFLDVRYNPLPSLDLTGCKKLKSLILKGCDKMTAMPAGFTELTSLDLLVVEEMKITSLDLSGMANLQSLYCNYTPLTSLDLTGCSKLSNILATSTQLTTVDISDCSQNLGMIVSGLHYWMNFKDNPQLKAIWVWPGFNTVERPHCTPVYTDPLYKEVQD